MAQSNKNKIITPLQIRNEAIIDEYMTNGYKKARAVKSIVKEFKNKSDIQAIHFFNSMIANKDSQKYLKSSQEQMRKDTSFSAPQVLKERLSWAYADATVFMGLSQEEFKDLPNEVRRQIQSFKEVVRETVDSKGNLHTTTTIEVKLVDKSDSLKEISKHIGFYEADNLQKNNTIDLSKASTEQLNVVKNLIESQMTNNQE